MENNIAKKNVSNEKRMESIKLRTRQNRLQQNLIQSALCEIDSGKSINKRIVFESDEEELQNDNGRNNNFVHNYSNGDKIQLFPDSDSENSRNHNNLDEDVFSIKPEFEGRKGQELWQLQSRFKNDERFRLDKRFLDNEGDEDDSIKEDETTETMDMATEREKNFEILQDVLGVQFPTKSAERKLAKYRAIKDTSRLRYDPTREDAKNFEIKRESKDQSSSKKKKQKKAEPEHVVLPEVSKEKFFNIAPNLKEAFTDKTSENRTFSFLQEFNNHDFSIEEDDGNSNYFTEPINKLGRTSFQKNTFKYDSTDNEDEEDKSQFPSSESVKEKSKASERSTSKAEWKFFFSADDSRLKEGVQYFKRSGTDEQIDEWWRRTRTTMLDLIQAKRKIYKRKTTMNRRRGKRGK